MDGFNWDNELVYYESDNKHLIITVKYLFLSIFT